MKMYVSSLLPFKRETYIIIIIFSSHYSYISVRMDILAS